MIFAGFDIGGTKCAAVIANAENDEIKILKRYEYKTQGTWQQITDTFCEKLKELSENIVSLDEIKACGVSCGSPLNGRKGIIMSPPNLPGWDNVAICDYIKKKTGIDTYLFNDADACALAEWRYGAGKGKTNVIFVTFGTGFGAGLILNGRLYEGACNLAGEIGHVRLKSRGAEGYGKIGSVESFCSGAGIAKQAAIYFKNKLKKGIKGPLCAKIDDIKNLTAKKIAEAAFNNDADAVKIYSECGKNLGKSLAILIDLLNPEMIIIGGVYMRSHSLLTKDMYRQLKRECLPESLKSVEIVPSELHEQIGDYGAIVAAIYGMERK